MPLLLGDDPDPAIVSGDILAAGPFLLIGDHAGRAIPHGLHSLGLSPSDRERHIAVDIGVGELGLALSARLAAPFIRQAYSRLVIDCNREPRSDEAIPETSDGTGIAGNKVIAPHQRQERVREIFGSLPRGDSGGARQKAGMRVAAPSCWSLHSFTPVFDGRRRPWHFGVLHNGGDECFSLIVLQELRRAADRTIGDNQPYEMDSTDFTIPFHAFRRGLAYLELEIRQDLIDGTSRGDTEAVAAFLGDTLIECAIRASSE